MVYWLLGITVSTQAASTCGVARSTTSSVLPESGWCWDPCALPLCAPLVLLVRKLDVESCFVFVGMLLPTHVCVLSHKRALQACDVKPLGVICRHFWMLHLRHLGNISSCALHYHCCTPLSYSGTLKTVLSSHLAVLLHAKQGNIIVLVDEELQSQKARWCVRTLRLEQLSLFSKI